MRAICEEHLQGRYELEVIDIYQQPTLAKGEQIIAAPTLIKKLPLPLRRVIGDMSSTERVLLGLDLRPAPLTRAMDERHAPDTSSTRPSSTSCALAWPRPRRRCGRSARAKSMRC